MSSDEDNHVCTETYQEYVARCKEAGIEPLSPVAWETIVRDGRMMLD
jgi:hypothetical protein